MLIEAENKRKNNPYEVRDARMSILEEFIIVMCLITFTIKDHDMVWGFNTALWIFVMILSIIECVKIWKRNKKNV